MASTEGKVLTEIHRGVELVLQPLFLIFFFGCSFTRLTCSSCSPRRSRSAFHDHLGNCCIVWWKSYRKSETLECLIHSCMAPQTGSVHMHWCNYVHRVYSSLLCPTTMVASVYKRKIQSHHAHLPPTPIYHHLLSCTQA